MSQHSALPFLAVGALILTGALTGCSAGAPAASASHTASGSAAASHAAAAAAGGGTGGGVANSVTAVPAHCPTAKEVSALFGYAVRLSITNHDSASLTCAYAPATTSHPHSIEIDFSTAEAGLTADGFGPALKRNAPQGVTVADASGVGQAAFEETGGLSPHLFVLNGNLDLGISANVTLPVLERVAKGILAG